VALLAAWLHIAYRDQQALAFVNVPAQMRAIIQVAGLEMILPLA
jgi:ABC-type transporter Mla MlaB component